MSIFPFLQIWLVIAAIGLALNLYGLHIALENKRRLIASGKNGARKIVANGNVSQERYRVAIQALLVYAGLIVIYAEPQTPLRSSWPFALMGVSILLVVKSFHAHIIRRQAIRALEVMLYENPNMPVELAGYEPPAVNGNEIITGEIITGEGITHNGSN